MGFEDSSGCLGWSDVKAKVAMIQDRQWPKMAGHPTDDEELRDWIIAETRTAESGNGTEDIESTTAQETKHTSTGSNGGIQTWECDIGSPAQHDQTMASTPYSQISSMDKTFFERQKPARKGLPVEFPGQHRELDLVPGSVYLVDSKGSFLKLPIPSSMPEDPLRWGYWKKTGAIACLLFFSMLSISSGQLPEINYQLLIRDPTMQVSGHFAVHLDIKNSGASCHQIADYCCVLEYWFPLHPATHCLPAIVRRIGIVHLGTPIYRDWPSTCVVALHCPSSRRLHHRCYRTEFRCASSCRVCKGLVSSSCLEPRTADHYRPDLYPRTPISAGHVLVPGRCLRSRRTHSCATCDRGLSW